MGKNSSRKMTIDLGQCAVQKKGIFSEPWLHDPRGHPDQAGAGETKAGRGVRGVSSEEKWGGTISSSTSNSTCNRKLNSERGGKSDARDETSGDVLLPV
jgi:hypothetical protein